MEADYLTGAAEMTEKIRFYLDHPASRMRVAAARRRRLLRGRHSIHDRLRQWAQDAAEWR